ncbi:CD177 antigen-like isoform X2 [Meriones unguiculatus]|nr:CD177 antigen-like isoform X2 [Meriones unguiculatus]
MGACPIQGFLLLSLLGFPACSDMLTCHKGIMLKSGSDFSKTPVEWKSFGTTQSEPGELCQETLLLIDIGEKSLILGSKGCSNPGHQKIKNVTVYSRGPGMLASSYVNVCGSDLCNKANSSDVLVSSLTPPACSEPGMTRCPVCLDFEGSCSELSNSVFCPRKTDCYTSDLVVKGGGINAIFSIDGCLVSSAKNLLKDQSSIGVFSVVEIPDSMTYNSSPNMLVPGTFLVWLLGLGLFLALCLEGFVFSAEPIFLPSLILPCPPSPDVTT